MNRKAHITTLTDFSVDQCIGQNDRDPAKACTRVRIVKLNRQATPPDSRDEFVRLVDELNNNFVNLTPVQQSDRALRVATLSMCTKCIESDRQVQVKDDILRQCSEQAVSPPSFGRTRRSTQTVRPQDSATEVDDRRAPTQQDDLGGIERMVQSVSDDEDGTHEDASAGLPDHVERRQLFSDEAPASTVHVAHPANTQNELTKRLEPDSLPDVDESQAESFLPSSQSGGTIRRHVHQLEQQQAEAFEDATNKLIRHVDERVDERIEDALAKERTNDRKWIGIVGVSVLIIAVFYVSGWIEKLIMGGWSVIAFTLSACKDQWHRICNGVAGFKRDYNMEL